MPPAILIISISAIAIYCAFVSFWLTGPLLMFWAEFLGILTKRNFYDKLAKQTAAVNMRLNIIFFVLLAYGFWTLDTRSLLIDLFLSSSFILLPVSVALSAVLSVIYLASWNKLRSRSITRALHLAIGLLTMLASFGIMLAGILLLLIQTGYINSLLDVSANLTLADTPKLLYLAAPCVNIAQCLAIGLAVGGMLTSLWLIMRRNREDYGRDYYRFALSFTTLWAAVGAAIGLIFNLWLVFFTSNLNGNLFNELELFLTIPISAMSLILLIAIIIWVFLSKSSNPMRYKPAIILAAFLTLISMPLAMQSFRAEITAQAIMKESEVTKQSKEAKKAKEIVAPTTNTTVDQSSQKNQTEQDNQAPTNTSNTPDDKIGKAGATQKQNHEIEPEKK